jgi:hypothetical protein
VSFAAEAQPEPGTDLEQPLLARFSAPPFSAFHSRGERGAGAGGPFAALDLAPTPAGSAASLARSDEDRSPEPAWQGEGEGDELDLAEIGAAGAVSGRSSASLGSRGASDSMLPTDVEDAEAAELPTELASELDYPPSRSQISVQVAPRGGGGGGINRPAWSSPRAAGAGAGCAPWGAGVELLHHSFSTPLLGDSPAAEPSSFCPHPASPTRFEAAQPAQRGPRLVGAVGQAPAAGAAPGGGGAGPWSPEVIEEARRRLLAGLKRYFVEKRGERLLSAEGLRCLNYACDLAADNADKALVRVRPLQLLTFLCAAAITRWKR